MALMLPNSIFFHIPKTGGAWARKAIERSGLFAKEIGICHSAASEVQHLLGDKHIFTFVRNPYWWYRSFWSYRMQNGWMNSNGTPAGMEIDRLCKSYDFNEFITKVTTQAPGYLGNMYRFFTGPIEMDFIGKTERLADDLVAALNQANEKFDEKRLRETPMHNTSNQAFSAEYTNQSKGRLREAERDAFELYGYA